MPLGASSLEVGSVQTKLELRVTPPPQWAVRPVVSADDSSDSWARKVCARFAESEPAGLFALAAFPLPAGSSGSVVFWQRVAAEFLRVLCHLPEGEELARGSLPEPSSALLARWVLEVPPMAGGEYINQQALLVVWERLRAWTLAEVTARGSLAEFLTKRASQWARVGRVTLHLAENKDDAEYPFAFMATYVAGLNAGGKLRRVPLQQALQEYAGAGQKAELLKLLSPLHVAAKRSELIADLVETGDVFHPLVWSADEAYEFLKEIPLYEDCGLLSLLPNWWKKRSRPRVSVSLDQKRGSGLGAKSLLQFRMGIALGEEELSEAEIANLLQSSTGLTLLRGEWVEVDSEKLAQAIAHWKDVESEVGAGGVSFIKGMRLLAGASAELEEGEVEEEVSWSHVEAGDRLRESLAQLRTPAGLGGEAPASFQGTLRDYQLAGVNWLWLCSRLGVGACLADDMGLGKTVQVLAILLRHQSEHDSRSSPSLLVVPASLIGNWKAEAARFAPGLRVFVAHASEVSKAELKELSLDPDASLLGYDLVVTTYGMVTRLDWIKAATWDWLILDEAQAIKNPSSRQTKAVKKLKAQSRVAMTGTPVENNLGDLWSLFDFINPGLLGNATRFKSFSKSLQQQALPNYAPLRKLISPYILRRMKTDPAVVPDLPDKTEMTVFCGLTKGQAALYQKEVKALSEILSNSNEDGIQRKGIVLSYLMRFKQICNHPSQAIGDGNYQPADSAKFARLASLCEEIASRGERVLVFTQFREMVAPLGEYMADLFGRGGLTLDGGTPVKKRKELVAQFQSDDGPPFMVLSIKAGGTGLNLTAASHVVHFDRWWNPAVENQATDRAFRIGQQRNVMVHKFVTRGTIEEKIDELIRGKQELADALLTGGAEKAMTEMSDSEILTMVSLDIDRAVL